MATKSDFLVRAGLTVATNTVTIGTSAYFVANGNVGIGTSSPKTRLQSTAATTLNAPSLGSATSAPFYVTNSDTAYGLLVGTNASDGHVWLQAQRTDGTATAHSITLNEAGGNVGIGTSSPSQKLDVNGIGRMRFSSGTGAGHWLDTIGNASRFFVGSDATAEAWRVYDSGGGGANRIYLDSSGNVGIGTSSPSTKLTVSGTQTIRGAGTDGGIYTCLYMDENTSPYTSTFAGYTLSLNTGGNSARTSRLYIDQNGNVGIGTTSPSFRVTANYTAPSTFTNATGDFLEMWQNGGANALGVAIETTAKVARFVNNNGYITAFNYTGTAEAMRIDSSGNLQLGTTTNLGKMTTVWNNSTQQGMVLYAATTTFNGSPVLFYNSAGGICGFIGQTASTVSYNTSSDYRLKENVRPMTTGLATISALKPVQYDWKTDGSHGEGFIAHELQEVIPLAVTGEKDAINEDGSIKSQGVDYSKIVVHLVAAIQELFAEVTALKAKLA